MKLDDRQVSLIDAFLRGHKMRENGDFELLEKAMSVMEIAIPVMRSEFEGPGFAMELPQPSASLRPESMTGGPLEVLIRENRDMAEKVLDAFRRGDLPRLRILISRSWVCYHNCNGTILNQMCDEDHAAATACQTSLINMC